jgi:nitrogen PTS system EIIA component
MANSIAELLTPADVLLDVDCSTREALFARVGRILAARHGISERAIVTGLTELGSTGLGHGVALPHARMPDLPHAVAAFVRTQAPITFDAPDGRLVSCLLFLLVPAHAAEHHLALMASAATRFSDRAFREQLRVAPDAAAVVALFAGGQATAAAPPA